jgi:hypothetical protein
MKMAHALLKYKETLAQEKEARAALDLARKANDEEKYSAAFEFHAKALKKKSDAYDALEASRGSEVEY